MLRLFDILQLIIAIIFLSLLSGCHSSRTSAFLEHTSEPQKQKIYRQLSKYDRTHVKYRGYYKVGKPYRIRGKIYRPKAVKYFTQIGIASWYGHHDGFHGRLTANGDIYNKNTLSAAHPTLPMPSLVKVTNLENGRAIIVLVNDRGPFVKRRVIDLSEQAAKILAMRKQGVAKVKVQYLPFETQQLLQVLSIEAKGGSRAKQRIAERHCSVNCYVQLVNLKYKYK